MNFEEMLEEYEKEMTLLISAHSEFMSQNANAKKQCQSAIAKCEEAVNIIVDEINKQEINKYTAKAFNELKDYFDAFNLHIVNPDFKGDTSLKNLYDNLNAVLSEKDKIVNKIHQLENEVQKREAEFNDRKQKLIRPVREEYLILTDNILVNMDLMNKEFVGASSLPSEIMIGNIIKPTNKTIENISNESFLRFPLTINVRDEGNIILQTDKSVSNESISRLVIAVLIKFFESFPYGTLSTGIINYTSFSCLDALHKAISKTEASLGDMIYEIRGVDQLIQDVTKRCADINGKLLVNGCSDIFKLYESGITTEKFQLVVIKDALRDISETNLRSLYSWIATYKKCGVRFIIVDDFDEDSYRGKSGQFKEIIEQIKSAGRLFSITDKVIKSDNHEQIELVSLVVANTDSDVYNYCSQYIKKSSATKQSFISYEKIGFGTNNNKTDSSISIPIAYNAPNIWNIEFHCTSKAPLANLIVGVPGTGKSRLIDAMILNGAIKYSPDELIFHLLDFKSGLSSNAYLLDCKIPHVKVVSRENKAEDADIILSSIISEQIERADEFKKYSVDSIAGYNKVAKKIMPRLIVVIDECQHIFEDESLAKKCEQIVREGRAFGIHLVLATQTITQQMMRTIKFVDGRYCFEITQADAEQLLNKEYAKRIAEISKANHKAFVTDFSSGEREIVKIEPAFDGDIDDDRSHRAAYAKQICQKWSQYPIDVFDVGNQESYFFDLTVQEKIKAIRGLQFFIGQNFQNRADIKLEFRNEKQSAVFLVNSQIGISENILSSLILQGAYKQLDMHVVNATGIKNVGELPLKLHLPANIVYSTESGYLQELYYFYSIFNNRMANPNMDYEPIIFVVNGLHNILDFTNNTKYVPVIEGNSESKDDIDVGRRLSFAERLKLQKDKPETSNKELIIYGKNSLMELLSNGYRVGIYLCCAIDSINVNNSSGSLFTSGDKNIIKQCNYKILDSDVGEDIRIVMEGSFREKMLLRMNNNICFMSEKQKNYYKIKYLQYDLNSQTTINVITKLLQGD